MKVMPDMRDRPDTFPRRMLLLIAALLFALPAGAFAQTVSWPEAWGCGAPSGRVDTDSGLTVRTASTARGNFAYYRFGKGSPIVLVTGFRATLANWNAYFVGALAQHHDVIVFDNRGIGGSPPVDGGYRVEDLADDTAALIASLGLKDVTLLGWSMGGEIVQQTALRHPDRIGRMVLMSTLPPGSSSTPVDARTLDVLGGDGPDHLRRVMAVLFPQGEVDRAMRCFVPDMFKPRDYTVPSISAPVVAAQQRLLQSWYRDEAALDRLRALRLPTLVLTGTVDTVVSPGNAGVLADALNGARLTGVQQGGHAMMYQFPVDLARRIASFIADTPVR